MEPLNSIVGKRVAGITMMMQDEMMQLEFYDGTLLRFKAVAWDRDGDILPMGEGFGEFDWEFDKLQEKKGE